MSEKYHPYIFLTLMTLLIVFKIPTPGLRTKVVWSQLGVSIKVRTPEGATPQVLTTITDKRR